MSAVPGAGVGAGGLGVGAGGAGATGAEPPVFGQQETARSKG